MAPLVTKLAVVTTVRPGLRVVGTKVSVVRGATVVGGVAALSGPEVSPSPLSTMVTATLSALTIPEGVTVAAIVKATAVVWPIAAVFVTMVSLRFARSQLDDWASTVPAGAVNSMVGAASNRKPTPVPVFGITSSILPPMGTAPAVVKDAVDT